MSSDSPTPDALRTRWPELLVAGLLLAVAALVIRDALRIGHGWSEDGPQAGYFPFRVGLLLGAASLWLMVQQLLTWKTSRRVFAEYAQLRLVGAMVVPMVLYVIGIQWLGLYAASFLLIGGFMWRHGRYRAGVTLSVAIGVPLVFFLVFERWFLVPLPKGPIERLLGF